jgi:hypothetical protein
MCPDSIDHFDEVDVLETPTTLELEVSGERGIVVGVSEADGERFFAVSIEAVAGTVMLGAADVRATGRRVTRDDIYGGSTLRVTREGHVVDESAENEE